MEGDGKEGKGDLQLKNIIISKYYLKTITFITRLHSVLDVALCGLSSNPHNPEISYYSLVAQTIKNPPAMWETRVRSLGWEDSLEEGMATHSSILAWRIPWTQEPGRLPSMGSQRVVHN